MAPAKTIRSLLRYLTDAALRLVIILYIHIFQNETLKLFQKNLGGS